MREMEPIEVGGVNYGQRLPAGRHGIPVELVAANQRHRLLRSASMAFAEEGYASMTVGSVVDRAGVSRKTFYQHFENKLDCVLAAQGEAFDALNEAIGSACSGGLEWPRRVVAAVDAVLALAVRSPSDVRLLLASSHAASEPQLAPDGVSMQERLIELLREGAASHPGVRTPDRLTTEATVGAALSIVGTCFGTPDLEPLADLRAEVRDGLVQIILTPYLGEAEARRIASSA